MIDIHQENQIHCSGGKLGIDSSAKDGNHIGNTASCQLVREEIKHLGLNIDREHLSLLANRPGQSTAVVPGPSTDISHDLTWFYFERLDYFTGMLFGFALRSFKPIGAQVPHNLGDFPAHI